MTKLKNSNCDKTHKTQIVTKTDEISQGSFLRSRDVFLYAPNLLGWLQEAPKQILCSLLRQYFIYFVIYLTIKINPLTFNLSNFSRPSSALFCVVLIKIYQKWYKICFTAYHTTPIIQKTSQKK